MSQPHTSVEWDLIGFAVFAVVLAGASFWAIGQAVVRTARELELDSSLEEITERNERWE